MEARLRPATVRQVRLVLFGAAVVGALIGVNNFILHVTSDPLADVRAYYDAGARLNAGQPLYDQPADTNAAAFYRYPPLLAIAFRPLALLPYPLAAAIWETALVAVFAWTVWRLGWRPPTWLALGMLAMPIVWSLVVGQAQVLVTALLVVGAPWAVALATHLKLLPALVAIFWIGRREWRRVGWFVAWCVGLILVQLALEPAATVAYLGFPNLSQVGEVNNLSIYAASPLVWALLVGAGVLTATSLAQTRYGWAAAVALSVLATPRLLAYQLSTLLAALRVPEADAAQAAGTTETGRSAR
jgi:hypothetical protein